MTDLLHTHTQCCFGRDLYTDMPHCVLQMVGFAFYKETFICVEKLGEKSGFNAGSVFPSCFVFKTKYKTGFCKSVLPASVFNSTYNCFTFTSWFAS